MTFRERLLATIAAARPVLETPGVLVDARAGMPDPKPRRATVAEVLRRLETLEGNAP